MRGAHFAAFVALLSAALAAAAQTTAPATSTVSARSESCRSASFEGRVDAGEAYSFPLGGALIFQLQPQGKDWGWQVVVSPRGSEDDWAYPVNPPLRGGNTQAMMTGWGESARQRLQYPHEVRFLLRKDDYERMSHLVDDALWPYSAKDPDHAMEAYFDALGELRTGVVVVTAVDFDQSSSPEIVRWMRFRAVVTVPRDFAGDPQLRWKAGACPPAPSF